MAVAPAMSMAICSPSAGPSLPGLPTARPPCPIPPLVEPTFVADVLGTYVVQLIVNDGTVDSLPATAMITADNIRPVANAGADQTVLVGQTVQLDGSGSSDVEGNLLTFRLGLRPPGLPAARPPCLMPRWSNPTFVADVLGTYVVQLIVNDGTVDSLPDTVTLSGESRPVANAGADQTVLVGQTVQLDGSGSSDVDGNLLTFSWALTARPASSQATLSDATLVNPTFVADQPGTYVVQLIVNDGTFKSLPDTVIVSGNSRPVANAGPDQTIFVGDSEQFGSTVQLDGSGSSDVDGNLLTFIWALISRPASSQAALSDATLVNPTFVADLPGTYVVQLTVNDGTFNSLPDTVVLSGESPPWRMPAPIRPSWLTRRCSSMAVAPAMSMATSSPSAGR